MSESLAWLPWSHRVLEGPLDVGTEQRWRIELDGPAGARGDGSFWFSGYAARRTVGAVPLVQRRFRPARPRRRDRRPTTDP